jgi:hypothetical protein
VLERESERVENVVHYFCEMPFGTYPGTAAGKILFHGIHVICVGGKGYSRAFLLDGLRAFGSPRTCLVCGDKTAT